MKPDIAADELVVSGGNFPFETIAEMLAKWGERQSEAVAISAPGRPALTYGALARQADAVRAWLRRSGIGPEDRVVLVLPNGPEMAVAFVAVAAAAATVPLNPAYREEEFGVALSRVGPKLMIVAEGHDTPARQAARARRIPVSEISIGSEAAGTFALPDGQWRDPSREAPAGSSNVALWLETSGTTGVPKWVALTQGHLFAMARVNQRALALATTDRCLNVMPLFHSTGLIGVTLASLASGGSVICAPGFFAPEFVGWVEEFRPTWFTAVPTMHHALLARARASQERPPRGTLRFVRSSSSRLPPSTLEGLEELFGAPVLESYGITETGMIACNPLPPARRKPGSVGIPSGLDIEIHVATGRPAPPRVPGEIVVRGPIAHRYEGDARATDEAFAGDWFKTGDQGYFDEDGYLFLTGRLKEMINRGGEKISPWEIEAALLLHPAVIEAVAFGVADAALSEEVAAAVVLRDKAAETERGLREFVAKRLADFKVPRWIRILEEIPKNALGKAKRSELPERLGLTSSDPARRPRPAIPEISFPRSPDEMLLTAIWQNVLGLDHVGMDEDFFALGGDSILATRILSRVRETFHVDLPLVGLFDTATIAKMTSAIRTASRLSPDDAKSNIERLLR